MNITTKEALLPPCRPVNPAVFPGEVMAAFLRYSREKLGEEKTSKLLEEFSSGRFSRVEEFVKVLERQETMPAAEFNSLGSLLLAQGLNLRQALEYALFFSGGTMRTYLYAVFQSLNYFSRSMWTAIKIGPAAFIYLAESAFEAVVNNSVLCDPHLEPIRGPERSLWVSHLILNPEILCWFQVLLAFHSHEIMSLIFFGEPAKVQLISPSELTFADPWLPGRQIKTGLRPSLRALTAPYGAEIKKRGEFLLIDGKEFAVADYHPKRYCNDGLYRLLYDLRPAGQNLILEKPRTLDRSYKEILAAAGHRFHLERPLPLLEFFVSFRNRRFGAVLPALMLFGLKRVWQIKKHPEANIFESILESMKMPLLVGPYSHDNQIERISQVMPTVGERRLEEAAREFGLTRREQEIIRHVLQGKTNREIAVAAQISEVTVKGHLSNIFQKLGIKNRSQLIIFFTSPE